jgi:hypothetical protein
MEGEREEGKGRNKEETERENCNGICFHKLKIIQEAVVLKVFAVTAMYVAKRRAM